MTRVRVGWSYLKTHSFSIGLETDNTCSCNNSTHETSLHYMFCTNYSEQRLILYQRIELIIPNIQKLPLKRQYEKFMYGYDVYYPEMTITNKQIMIATQTYILKTKRFAHDLLFLFSLFITPSIIVTCNVILPFLNLLL